MRPSGRRSNRFCVRNAVKSAKPFKRNRRGDDHDSCGTDDVAHLGHVELLTDKPEASLDFFSRVFGLTESGREGDSVYLRAYDDYEFHSLKLTAAKTTGSRHIAYRAASPQALERRVEVLEQMGCGIGWDK